MYIYSVSELLNSVKLTLIESFPAISIIGEVTDLNKSSKSGHIYFTLKDPNNIEGNIACAVWKQSAERLSAILEVGLVIEFKARLSIFPNSKIYLNIQSAVVKQSGVLEKSLQELGNKLESNGIFKKSKHLYITKFPKTIGLITSNDGAVIEDIKTTLVGRFHSQILLYDVPVQGENAYIKIIEAITYFSQHKTVDFIIIARGGGSLDDLSTFNNESLVVAIANSSIPIITAIGHGTNTSLSDKAATVSVATPTASVIFLPQIADLSSDLNKKLKIIKNLNVNNLDSLASNLNFSIRNLKTPKLFIATFNEKAMYLQKALERFKNNILQSRQQNIYSQLNKLKNPINIIENNLNLLNKLHYKLQKIVINISASETNLHNLKRLLHSLSFENTLKRGFSILYNKQNKIVKVSTDLIDGEHKIQFYDSLKDVNITTKNKFI